MRGRTRLILVATAITLLAAAAAQSAAARTHTARARTAHTRSARVAGARLSIRIVGNHFVNQRGRTIRLLGVDVPGTEYACEQGWGFSQNVDTPALAAQTARAVAAWRADAVRVPLNEDCWLGINGKPAYRGPLGRQSLAQAVVSYHRVVERFVAALNARGIYAILDLHWTAPGALASDNQRPMPDAHAIAFWRAVASAFKRNHAVVFDLFNEPYSPALFHSDDHPLYPVSWHCWEDGGCLVPDTANGLDPGDDPPTYPAVGMQTLVNAVRSVGARQPLMLGGLSYSNDLTGWLRHEPRDPIHQLAASWHVYQGNTCDTIACFNAQAAPVARRVPLVTGEFDGNMPCQGGGAAWQQMFMGWADRHHVSYLGWGWFVLGPGDCSNYTLITNWNGAPAAPDGTGLRAHLIALAEEK